MVDDDREAQAAKMLANAHAEAPGAANADLSGDRSPAGTMNTHRLTTQHGHFRQMISVASGSQWRPIDRFRKIPQIDSDAGMKPTGHHLWPSRRGLRLLDACSRQMIRPVVFQLLAYDSAQQAWN